MTIKAHTSVLLKEAINFLNVLPNKTYLDATFGAGGYSREILKCDIKKLYAIDRDPYVTKFANEIKNEYKSRFEFINCKFSELESLLDKGSIELLDGIVFDLGVSSMQLDQGERGFSFSKDALLDMRMGSDGMSAIDVINEISEEDLANIIFQYGEERYSRKIAKSIVTERHTSPITNTIRLADIIRRSIPNYRQSKIDPATKTFQAIRIYVNDELQEIQQTLKFMDKLLKPGGRLVVVSFHSLEDSLIKSFLKEHTQPKISRSKYNKQASEELSKYPFIILTKKVVVPDNEEIKINPRARSAKLRAAIRTDFQSERDK